MFSFLDNIIVCTVIDNACSRKIIVQRFHINRKEVINLEFVRIFVIYIFFKYIFYFVVGTRRDGEKIERGELKTNIYYSHSVVPGGLGVRSYRTREIPGTVDISITIFFTT